MRWPPTSLIANHGDRTESEVGGRFHLSVDERGVALRGRGPRSVLAPHGRVVDARGHDNAARDRRLLMASCRRGGTPRTNALLDHSDQGSQYISEAFRRLLHDLRVTCSMSRAGNVWEQLRDGELLGVDPI